MSEEEHVERTEVPSVPPEALSNNMGLLTEEVSRVYMHICTCNTGGTCKVCDDVSALSA